MKTFRPRSCIGRRLLILNSIGCGLYASQKPWGRILTDTFSELESGGTCTVWGTDRRLTAPARRVRKRCHGSRVRNRRYSSPGHDTYRLRHRAGLFALAETRGPMTGRDFLRSAIAGYETAPRIGQCVGQEHLGKGWHPTGTIGTFGAAAASSAALRLSEEQTVHALGLAGSQAAGIMAVQFGAMMKRGHAGRACQSGLYSAMLAKNGFTGVTNVFESPFGRILHRVLADAGPFRPKGAHCRSRQNLRDDALWAEVLFVCRQYTDGA